LLLTEHNIGEPISREYAPIDPEPDPEALDLWGNSEPIERTLGALYWTARGIALPPPATLRFLPSVPWFRRADHTFPALVAAIYGPAV
jgi:hypothetical protein